MLELSWFRVYDCGAAGLGLSEQRTRSSWRTGTGCSGGGPGPITHAVRLSGAGSGRVLREEDQVKTTAGQEGGDADGHRCYELLGKPGRNKGAQLIKP